MVVLVCHFGSPVTLLACLQLSNQHFVFFSNQRRLLEDHCRRQARFERVLFVVHELSRRDNRGNRSFGPISY